MERYVVKGGLKLSGSVRVESAKNAVLPMMAAACLTDEEVVIKNCPKIGDVLSMIEILRSIGVKTKFEDNNLVINASSINSYKIPCELGGKLRSSVYMLGALCSRLKIVETYRPGGCDIGARPIDIHLKGLNEFGVSTSYDENIVRCNADRLIGRRINLDFPSVGATENLMIIGALADGKTELYNVAKEPEVIDLMRFLNSMGAKIYGAGTNTILIEGVKKLHATVFEPISDRIETGTFLLAAAITGGEVEIKGCNPKNIYSLIHKLCDNTCKINLKNDIIYLKSNACKKAFSFKTGPYPYFPTDLQAQTMALLTVSDGVSNVTEAIFEKRFGHVSELIKMGADIVVKGRTASVRGVKTLHGGEVYAKDLRGGAALTLAALCAEGQTVIHGAQHVNRGYYNIDKKLRALGADVNLTN